MGITCSVPTSLLRTSTGLGLKRFKAYTILKKIKRDCHAPPLPQSYPCGLKILNLAVNPQERELILLDSNGQQTFLR